MIAPKAAMMRVCMLLTALTITGLFGAQDAVAQCQGPSCLGAQVAYGEVVPTESAAATAHNHMDTCYWVTWGVVQFRGGVQPEVVKSGIGTNIGDRAYCSSVRSTGAVKQAFERALRDRYQNAKSISVQAVRVSTSPHTARMWTDEAVGRLKKYYNVSQVTHVPCLRYLEDDT